MDPAALPPPYPAGLCGPFLRFIQVMQVFLFRRTQVNLKISALRNLKSPTTEQTKTNRTQARPKVALEIKTSLVRTPNLPQTETNPKPKP
jgi:hypothetical protein